MLTHIDEKQQPTMVDVSAKVPKARFAHASCTVNIPEEIHLELQNGDIQSKKGPVFQTAIIAGTMAAKRTSDLIPFCHPVPLESCKINIEFTGRNSIRIDARVRTTHKTGVEMEALCAAQIAALTIYDMCKAMSHAIEIGPCHLIEKTGGKHDFRKTDG